MTKGRVGGREGEGNLELIGEDALVPFIRGSSPVLNASQVAPSPVAHRDEAVRSA